MSYFEILLENCIFLLCPLSIYLLYMIYRRNLSIEEKDLSLELALISSLYLVLKFGTTKEAGYSIMLFDIPLLISYYKRKIPLAIFISLTLVCYEYLFLNINPYFAALEYSCYLIIYSLMKKKLNIKTIINNFIIVKSFMLALAVFWFLKPEASFNSNIIYILSMILIIYIITNVIIYFFIKGEKIVELSNDLEKIEKEKELRKSLFKVTHEIKNPIAVCKGYLDMLDLNDKKKVRKYIPIIKEEITRTLILMDDFLDYTKIKIEKEEIDLIMLLEELECSLEPLFKKRKIKATFELPDDEIYLEADYNRLKQVFINIFKNAIEAEDSKREHKYVKLKLEIKDQEIQIIIEDNGIGMDKETLEKVSEMFFTTKAKGSGLGISLSKEIIELHGGTIMYNSVKGKGTRVIVTLPKNLNMP